MEIAIMVLSWILTIVFALTFVSMPVDKLLQMFVKDWKGSKGQTVYHNVELVGVAIVAAVLLVLIVLMAGHFA